MTPWEALELFLDQLRALLSVRIDTEDALRIWQRRAGELTTAIRAVPGACDELPEALWHFLADADLRFSANRPVGTMDPSLAQELSLLRHKARSRARARQ